MVLWISLILVMRKTLFMKSTVEIYVASELLLRLREVHHTGATWIVIVIGQADGVAEVVQVLAAEAVLLDVALVPALPADALGAVLLSAIPEKMGPRDPDLAVHPLVTGLAAVLLLTAHVVPA